MILACSALASADGWIEPARLAYTIDAMQTYSIRSSRGEFNESNWLYRQQGNAEAAITLLASNWLIERAITGIRNPKLRNAVGWLFVGYESSCVVHNFQVGVRIKL